MLKWNKLGVYNQQTLSLELRTAFSGGNEIGCVTFDGGITVIVPEGTLESEVDVVDDDFANGWRTVSKDDLKTDNLLEGITEYLFNPAPCCCIYNPDNDRHDYLLDKVKQSGADGVLFWYIKFCEPDAFDRPQLMKHLKKENIPNAFVDLELSMSNFDAVKTRVNAFCEILGS